MHPNEGKAYAQRRNYHVCLILTVFQCNVQLKSCGSRQNSRVLSITVKGD